MKISEIAWKVKLPNKVYGESINWELCLVNVLTNGTLCVDNLLLI